MSDLYFNEECYYSEENVSDNEDFCSTILEPFQFDNEQKKLVMKTMRKKLNICMLQLSIYCILEYEILISANADIAKTKREKLIDCLFFQNILNFM